MESECSNFKKAIAHTTSSDYIFEYAYGVNDMWL